ncbi:hypothetical protein [Actinophytocola sp.]|uniref:hypothetical protein n=1 Tax=Actinophytocola sp. TaxID=1872138 RepID=UPI002ED118C9
MGSSTDGEVEVSSSGAREANCSPGHICETTTDPMDARTSADSGSVVAGVELDTLTDGGLVDGRFSDDGEPCDVVGATSGVSFAGADELSSGVEATVGSAVAGGDCTERPGLTAVSPPTVGAGGVVSDKGTIGDSSPGAISVGGGVMINVINVINAVTVPSAAVASAYR